MRFPYASIVQVLPFALLGTIFFAVDYRSTMSFKGNDLSSLLGPLVLLGAGTKPSSVGQLAIAPRYGGRLRAQTDIPHWPTIKQMLEEPCEERADRGIKDSPWIGRRSSSLESMCGATKVPNFWCNWLLGVLHKALWEMVLCNVVRRRVDLAFWWFIFDEIIDWCPEIPKDEGKVLYVVWQRKTRRCCCW